MSTSKVDSGLKTPVQFVKGVGPKLGYMLAGRGISTVWDLFTFFPRAYEDRSKMFQVKDLQEGVTATLRVHVISSRLIPLRARGRTMLEIRTQDPTGPLSLKWFHVPKGMVEQYKPGMEMTVTGTPKKNFGKLEIIHPELNSKAQSDTDFGRIIPVYVEIEGIPTRTLRKVLFSALEKFSNLIAEDLPEQYLTRHGLPKLKEAIQNIHFPPADTPLDKLNEFQSLSQLRLIYEEFFKFETIVLRRRLRMEKEKADPIALQSGALQDLQKMLPFQLTGAQQKAITEILKDLSEPHPMNRLLQGDVGSGKTAVAFLTAGHVIAQGGQVAMMVPTEILAEQHFRNAIKLFGGNLAVGILTGKTTAKERALLQGQLAGGKPMLLIGTQALLEDPVQFASLQYVLVDEQHRFGVDQRRILRGKAKPGFQPHTLVLTATPIPRTLALTAYGDLAVSMITEKPPGRTPIQTKVFRQGETTRAYDLIRKQILEGRQAYIIFPLVNESEAEGFTHMKAAVTEAERLAKDVFPEFKIGLLHGQLKGAEKDAVMQSFARGETHILVSTTVVEVGVDVPNSTVIAVEHAERFGLSQLHQLRGRVGRGKHDSYCLLITPGTRSEVAIQRLEVLEKTDDGFQIAEADLEIRGPGEFLGTRQSGDLPFRLANLVRDQEWLLRARDDVLEMLRLDPDLKNPEHVRLREFFVREGKAQSEILHTS